MGGDAVVAASRADHPAVEHDPRLPGAHDQVFRGPHEQERWQAREWLSWEADRIAAVARVRHSARFRKMHDEVIAEFRPRAEAALAFVDSTVKGRPILVAGECTIADIGCWGRMVFMAEDGFEIGQWPHLEAWAARLSAMPGFALPYALVPSKDQSSRQRPATCRISASPGTLARQCLLVEGTSARDCGGGQGGADYLRAFARSATGMAPSSSHICASRL